MLGQVLKGGLDGPAAAVKLSDLFRRGDGPGQIGEQVDVRVTVSRLALQAHADASQAKHLALLIEDMRALF
jgi:hypothetical protein